MNVEIDFEVFKALTARRASENVTHNDVLRDLLGLQAAAPPAPAAIAAATISAGSRPAEPGGYIAADRWLPDGTELRAKYKGAIYTAQIEHGLVRSTGGKLFKSLSAAAKSITGNNVNGLRFWNARVGGDHEWRVVIELPKRTSI